jgi:hypothetical protein
MRTSYSVLLLFSPPILKSLDARRGTVMLREPEGRSLHMSTPIYVTQPVDIYADEQRNKMLAMGMSTEAADARRADILKRGVQVKNAFESNALASGKVPQ